MLGNRRDPKGNQRGKRQEIVRAAGARPRESKGKRGKGLRRRRTPKRMKSDRERRRREPEGNKQHFPLFFFVFPFVSLRSPMRAFSIVSLYVTRFGSCLFPFCSLGFSMQFIYLYNHICSILEKNKDVKVPTCGYAWGTVIKCKTGYAPPTGYPVGYDGYAG